MGVAARSRELNQRGEKLVNMMGFAEMLILVIKSDAEPEKHA